MTLALGRFAGCRRRIALAFDFSYLLLHHGKPLELSSDFAGKPGGQAMTIAGQEFVDYQSLVLRFDVDAPNALGEQQSLDPVDVRSPLADQPAPLTVGAPQILLVDTRNAHERPNVPLAPAPGDQRA